MGFKLTECNLCGSKDLRRVMNEEIYGRRYGHGKTIQCFDCKHFVGCHNNWNPMGLISNREMKDMKMKCHELFDQVWKSKIMGRTRAYKVLAKVLGIESKDCHFGYFDMDMLNKAYGILQGNWYKGVYLDE